MHILKTMTAGLAAAALALGSAPAAATTTTTQAEQLRRLDIMLMVTSLRCRMGPDNFQPAYQSFTSRHVATLNQAARTLQAGLVQRHGAKGAARALDRIGVGIANFYGEGHPWLGCRELKAITTDLASATNPAVLVAAAEELLATAPAGGGRFAAR